MSKPMEDKVLKMLEKELQKKITEERLSYTDNYRYARTDNEEEMAEYNEQIYNGCCGFFDYKFTHKGVEYTIGCNYGH